MGASQSQPSSPPPAPEPPAAVGTDEVRGFSADTKAVFRPSIPFEMSFGVAGKKGEQRFTIDKMTLYHPCPLRLEGVQPDAVLSLNDPSFGAPNYVVLVPLVGRNTQSPSISFIEKIASQVVAVSSPDPSTGQYIERDIPTGADWSLQKLFATKPTGNGFEVSSGYYVWQGMPPLRRVRKESGGTIEFKWEKDPGSSAPTYIMLDTPVACNPADIAVLTQRMPVTPPTDAIHAVLYNGTDPMNRGIVHKGGPGCSARERFTTQEATKQLGDIYQTGLSKKIVGESCDPWTAWAQTTEVPMNFSAILFNILTALAMFVGAYLALSAILRMYDQEVKSVSETIGQVIATFYKTFSQKVQRVSQLRAELTNPTFTSMTQTRS